MLWLAPAIAAGHETWPTVIEGYIDWCDKQFRRGKTAFPERLLYPHDWDALPVRQRQTISLAEDAPIRDRVNAMIGSASGAGPYVGTYGIAPGYIDGTISRGDVPSIYPGAMP